jgi:hypothetical protein
VNILAQIIHLVQPDSSVNVDCTSVLVKNKTTKDTFARVKFYIGECKVKTSAEQVALMFQPFNSLQAFRKQDSVGEGSKLGLALAREIIELHGGYLEFRVNSTAQFDINLLKFWIVIPFKVPNLLWPDAKDEEATRIRTVSHTSNDGNSAVNPSIESITITVVPDYCLIVDGKI